MNDLKLLANQVSNIEESVLFWKLQADHTLVYDKETSAATRQSSQEKLFSLVSLAMVLIN